MKQDNGAFIALKRLQDPNDKVVDGDEAMKKLEKIFGEKTLEQIIEAKNATDEDFVEID